VLLGVKVALLLDAASFVLGAVVLAGLRMPRPADRPEKPPITAGFRDILADPVLRLLAALVVVTGVVSSLPEVVGEQGLAVPERWLANPPTSSSPCRQRANSRTIRER
jgi:hypothetical protein